MKKQEGEKQQPRKAVNCGLTKARMSLGTTAQESLSIAG
jgi:hypothetical protein